MIVRKTVFLGAMFLQSLDVNDITKVMTTDLTVTGMLLGGIIMLWRRMLAAEEKIDVIRKEKDEDYKKYVEILISTTKVIDENTKMFARLEKLLDK